jgi:hypothetical protein
MSYGEQRIGQIVIRVDSDLGVVEQFAFFWDGGLTTICRTADPSGIRRIAGTSEPEPQNLHLAVGVLAMLHQIFWLYYVNFCPSQWLLLYVGLSTSTFCSACPSHGLRAL